MTMKPEIADWGLIPYEEAWNRQREWFNEVVAAKQAGQPCHNRIVLCEHPPVYTLGRSGKASNMLLGEEQLKRVGATLYHIDRGGDITYHGPGQLVCYPILNLEDFSLGRHASCPQDMRHGGTRQPFRDDARPGLERQYRLALLQLHPSVWFRGQRGYFLAEGTASRGTGGGSEKLLVCGVVRPAGSVQVAVRFIRKCTGVSENGHPCFCLCVDIQ